MGDIIGPVILGVVSLTCFIVSIAQFKEKGFLFNNEYLFASEQKRKTMDKKPHYRQSGVVFLLLAVLFLILDINIIFHIKWLICCEVVIIIALMLYAIISSVQIEKRK